MNFFSGSHVAIVTPFKGEERSIDFESLDQLVYYHMQSGTDGLVIGGTTGEGCSLNTNELFKVAQFIKDKSQGKLVLTLGVGHPSTQMSVEFTMGAKKLGMDAVLCVTPYYNRPTQKGLISHFEAVASVGLPVILYHHPKRAAVSLEKESIFKLSDISNIIGIKEVSGDFGLAQQIVKNTSLSLFSGEDTQAISFMAIGAQGSINVTGNLFPRAWKKILAEYEENKLESSQALFAQLADFMDAIFNENNPQGIKYAMQVAGLINGMLRLPLVAPSLTNRKMIEEAYQNLSKSIKPVLSSLGA